MVAGDKAKGLLKEVHELLNVVEDGEAAEAKAREAIDLFDEAKDENGKIDAIRYLVMSWKLQVDQWRYDKAWGSHYDIKETLKQGDAYCLEMLEEFEASGSVRGKGAMLLSLAHLNFDKRGPKKRALALDWAAQAEKCLRKVKDEKLIFLAVLAQSNIHFANSNAKKAMEKAQQAVNIAMRAGEKEDQAHALYMVGMSCGLDKNLKLGLEAHMEALSLYRETGNKKYQAFELHLIAEWQLSRQRPKEALHPAMEALNMFEELEYGKGWHGTALRTVINCHLVREEFQNAKKMAIESMNKFKEKNDRRMITVTYDILAHVYMANDELLKALDCAEAAVTNSKGMHDEEAEAVFRQTLSTIHMRLGEDPTAVENQQLASELYGKIGDHVHECQALIDLCSVYVASGNVDEAIKAAKKADKIAEEKKAVSTQASAKMAMASAQFSNDNAAEALQTAFAAVKLFSKDRNSSGEGIACGLLSQIQQKMGDMGGAMASAKKGRMLLSTSDQLRLQASGYQTLADLHMATREYRQALKLGLEAKVSCKKAEDKYGEVSALITVLAASVQLMGGEAPIPPATREYSSVLEKAQAAAKAALVLTNNVESPSVRGVVHFWSANLTLITTDAKSALDEAREAHSLLVEGRDRWNEGRAIYLLGQIYQEMDQKEKAIDNYKDALEIAREQKDKDGEEAARKILTKLRVFGDPNAFPTMTPEMMAMMAAGVPGPAAAAPAAQAVAAAPAASAGAAIVAGAGTSVIPTIDQVRNSLIRLAGDVAADADGMQADVSLMDAGIDSLAAVQFRNDVAKEYDLQLPASLIFDYPTINDMSEQIRVMLMDESAG